MALAGQDFAMQERNPYKEPFLARNLHRDHQSSPKPRSYESKHTQTLDPKLKTLNRPNPTLLKSLMHPKAGKHETIQSSRSKRQSPAEGKLELVSPVVDVNTPLSQGLRVGGLKVLGSRVQGAHFPADGEESGFKSGSSA